MWRNMEMRSAYKAVAIPPVASIPHRIVRGSAIVWFVARRRSTLARRTNTPKIHQAERTDRDHLYGQQNGLTRVAQPFVSEKPPCNRKAQAPCC